MTKVYDHSVLRPITHCPRLYYYEYRARLRPKGGFPPLLAGSAGHEALAVLYRDGWDEVEEAVRVLRSNYSLRPVGWPEWLTPAHMEIVIRNYVDFYRDRDPYTDFEVVEEPIVSEAGGLLSFPFGGIPDLIQRSDDPSVIDHKFTVGYFGNKESEARYQKQGKLYVALARRDPDLDFDGNRAVFNLISMREKVADPNFTGQRFERVSFDYTDHEIREALWWADGAKRTLDWYEEVAGDQERLWTQNGGRWCKFCSFRDLCYAKNPALKESARRTGFEVRSEPRGLLLSGADG